ncbi:PDZ domain-containing protein [Nocardioides sp. zg-1228]|uniref:YlbL family protein n=1 Tax=Nocardioides sp. zg-1228 TaxID=2763008 RepID=UPI0016426C27|nr:S16 family serine protease [Nocardioides sp. zg-1228]MBC2933958.1 PDZ domain-containing protein [Nocardioides sp. zg-1228]QSF58718.1 PDZ domain-containing protein [Nocardioides sp. zg-1228]
MKERTGAGLLALCLLAALWAAAAFVPLPYVTYYPGPTVDILADDDGKEIVQVAGRKAYHDDGELRMTTVYVSTPQEDVSLPELLQAYFDPDAAVWPRSSIYAPDETDESTDRESEAAMASSQDTAVAAALTELGEEVDSVVKILDVTPGLPADGKLEVRDVLLRVGDTPIREAQDVVDAVDEASPGEPLTFLVRRGEKEVSVDVTPEEVEGDLRIGIAPGLGFDFPFDVSVDISERIGGPSAGLMMALAIYDTLTPGSLTGGAEIAGTGTITPTGEVGPIGGIQQKIAAARDAGADLFFVPAANCGGIGGVDPGDMRLAKATTMHAAVETLSDWVADPDTDLPTCEDTAS